MRINKQKMEVEMARKGLTSQTIQKESGVPLGTYVKVVSGKSTRPITVGKIAQAIGCDVLAIIEEVQG